MRTTQHLSLLAALVFAAGTPLLAQEAKAPAPLSLQQVLDLTFKNQTDIITARNNVLIAKSRTSQTLAAYLPQLSIQNNAFSGGTGVLNKVTNGTAFSASQNVFDGGVREANMVGARYGVTQSTAGLSRTVQTVTFNVTKSYYEVLRSKHLAEVSDASVKYNEELRQQIESRAALGDVAKVDLLPVEAQLANARVSQLTAENAVRTASLTLQNTMGLSPTPGFDVQDVETMPKVNVEQLKQYVDAALKTRPDVLQSQAGSGAARASLRAARINLYPRPVITGQYQRQIQGGFTTSGSQIVGGIVFDLFNGGANRALYKEAQANQANANQQALQVGKDIQAQVEQAYLNLTNADQRQAASEVGQTAAQANYDAQKDRYGQGLATPLDLLNAQLQLITAQSNLVQARYDYYIAIAQMDFSVGKQGGFNAN
jgi:outer membrane protein